MTAVCCAGWPRPGVAPLLAYRPMTFAFTPSNRAAGALILIALAAIVAAILSAGPPRAAAATTGQLQQQISSRQGQINSLSGAVSSANHDVHRLSAGVATLERQVGSLQNDLDAKRTQLLRLRGELDAAHKRLAELEAAQTRAEAVLSQQLIGSYESDRPDLISVVLESTGFNNLLERLAFVQRIRSQDAHITGQVKAARRAVARQAIQLGQLSLRQQRITDQVLYERNRVGRAQYALYSQELAVIHVRDHRAGQLSSVRQTVSDLQGKLARLQAAQARAAQAPSSSSGSGPSGPGSGPGGSPGSGSGGSPAPSSAPPSAPSGGGGFVFPLPKSAASPPGTWSLDDGVDISAPGGTPEYAVCSGTVVLHGIGGFGPSAPVLHCDSSLSGYSYVYYGHAGPGDWVPVGAHVSAGQVISQVGYGIVGISTGPHVEMGFADSSGSPVGPSSAPAMAALLHAAFGG